MESTRQLQDHGFVISGICPNLWLLKAGEMSEHYILNHGMWFLLSKHFRETRFDFSTLPFSSGEEQQLVQIGQLFLGARARATSNIETSEEPQVGQLGSASRFWGWRIFIFPPTWFASHYYPFLLVDILTSAGQNQHLSSSSSSFIFLYFVRTVIQSHAVARDQFS